MLVVPTRRKLVINTDIRDKILAVMPHAREMLVEGKPMVAVNHGVEECLVLRNLGFRSVPSPILSYYKWSGRFPPMAHQKTTAAFLTAHRKCLCLSDPGTGKTASALWAADFLLREGVVRKVLIVSPLSTVKTVWGNELKLVLPHRNFELLTGSRERRFEKLWSPGVEFCVVNHDGVKVMQDYLELFDLIIYDEATALKNPGTERFRIFNSNVIKSNPWLWLLTGTPFGQTPVDAWALAKVVSSPYLTKSFTGFKDLVMNRVSTFRWVPKPTALATCKQVLQPSIRFTLDECQDIPETLYVDRQTAMSPAQAKAFKAMRERAVVTLDEATVTAVNSAVVFQKLIQIVCGVVYDSDGDRVQVDASQRLDDLKELIEEAGEKVIVFVPLRGVQDWLAKELAKDYSVASVHGDVSATERSVIFHNFQNEAEPRVLLAHPKVASHGLTLTASRTVIWYAPIYSLEMYEQANARIRRIGQKGKTRVVHMWATNFEKELYSRLQHKKRVLGNFLELVKGENYGG